MERSFLSWLQKRENYGGMTGAPSFATPGPDGFGSSVPVTAMPTYEVGGKPKKMKKGCNNKKKK